MGQQSKNDGSMESQEDYEGQLAAVSRKWKIIHRKFLKTPH